MKKRKAFPCIALPFVLASWTKLRQCEHILCIYVATLFKPMWSCNFAAHNVLIKNMYFWKMCLVSLLVLSSYQCTHKVPEPELQSNSQKYQHLLTDWLIDSKHIYHSFQWPMLISVMNSGKERISGSILCQV